MIDISQNREGLKDILASVKNIKLPIYLAYSDIRQRYRRSSLGPFWITISMGISIACIGLIFGGLFKAPMSEFLPFIASGLILWGFINTILCDAASVFPSAEAAIRQLPLPLFTHLARMILRNVYILLHNLIVLPIVFLCVSKPISWTALLAIPGFLLVVVNLTWMSLILSILCTRFRDLTQIVINTLQIFFYVTPIIWFPKLLPAKDSVMVLDPNPFFHLISLVRSPLLGTPPSIMNWIFSLIMAVVGCSISVVFFNAYRNRIAYWL